MADQSDVEVALVNVVSAALYPNGTSEASSSGAGLPNLPWLAELGCARC